VLEFDHSVSSLSENTVLQWFITGTGAAAFDFEDNLDIILQLTSPGIICCFYELHSAVAFQVESRVYFILHSMNKLPNFTLPFQLLFLERWLIPFLLFIDRHITLSVISFGYWPNCFQLRISITGISGYLFRSHSDLIILSCFFSIKIVIKEEQGEKDTHANSLSSISSSSARMSKSM